MENTNVNETVNNVTENDEPIRVLVEEKEGFGAKCKNGISKFVHSTPGKIIGGIGLVAAGVVGTLLVGLLSNDDTDEDNDEAVADVDYTELVDDEESEVTE